MPLLRILSRDARRVDRELPLGGAAITIGRAPENALVVHDSSVSRTHARIVPTPSGYLLVDLNSANGSWVRDERVEETVLLHGDIFRLGDCWLQFVDEPMGPITAEEERLVADTRRHYWIAAALVAVLLAGGCLGGVLLYVFRDRFSASASQPRRSWDSGMLDRYGLMSRMGVPSNMSTPRTWSERPSRRRSSTTVSPSGFGR
jgi:hypothetical protein